MSNFFNDISSEEDFLGYYPYVEAFNYIINNTNKLITPPLVFGIHGKWGSGKTTFMNLIKASIDKEENFYTVWINPWEYGDDQNFITVFLAKLYKEVSNKIDLDKDKHIASFIKCIFKPLKLSLDFNAIKLDYDFEKFSLDQQKGSIDKFISENFALKESISNILDQDIFENKKIVVFIDDLDRCNVERVMEVLESIKLILNSRNCLFFLGCDLNYLESALSNKYEKFIKYSKENENKNIGDLKEFSREYLEKLIQIPFYIPTISSEYIKKYINSILNYKYDKKKNSDKNKAPLKLDDDIFNMFRNDLKDDFIAELIISTNINPRRIKRILNLTFLNYIFMKFKDMKNDNFIIDAKLLSLLCIIREVYPSYYKQNLSYEQSCINTFRQFYEYYKKDVKDLYNDENNQDNLYKLINENYDIYKLFESYFVNQRIKKSDELLKKLKYISMYISVSNISTSEDYRELEWGELSNIKSEITGKKLNTFLSQLSRNQPAKDIIFWFFNSVYLYDRNKFVLGIVKNIQVYIKINSERSWIFRFDFNKARNILYISFEWRNNFKTIIDKVEDKIKSTLYDPQLKRIEITNDIDQGELEEIKSDLITLIESLNVSNEYVYEEIASENSK